MPVDEHVIHVPCAIAGPGAYHKIRMHVWRGRVPRVRGGVLQKVQQIVHLRAECHGKHSADALQRLGGTCCLHYVDEIRRVLTKGTTPDGFGSKFVDFGLEALRDEAANIRVAKAANLKLPDPLRSDTLYIRNWAKRAHVLSPGDGFQLTLRCLHGVTGEVLGLLVRNYTRADLAEAVLVKIRGCRWSINVDAIRECRSDLGIGVAGRCFACRDKHGEPREFRDVAKHAANSSIHTANVAKVLADYARRLNAIDGLRGKPPSLLSVPQEPGSQYATKINVDRTVSRAATQ